MLESNIILTRWWAHWVSIVLDRPTSAHIPKGHHQNGIIHVQEPGKQEANFKRGRSAGSVESVVRKRHLLQQHPKPKQNSKGGHHTHDTHDTHNTPDRHNTHNTHNAHNTHNTHDTRNTHNPPGTPGTHTAHSTYALTTLTTCTAHAPRQNHDTHYTHNAHNTRDTPNTHDAQLL